MMKSKTCPNCDKYYSGYKCNCGFKESYSKNNTQSHPDALKCCWYENGTRCNRQGTMADHPYACAVEPPESRNIYCPWHYEVLENPEFARNKDQVDMYFKRLKQYETKSIMNY